MAGISKEEFRVTRRASDSGQLLPGDDYVIEPGHDAWVIGWEPLVGFEFDSKAAETFARRWESLFASAPDPSTGRGSRQNDAKRVILKSA